MGRPRHPYLMAAYLEALLAEGIRTEERFVADAGRFIRYLLVHAGPDAIEPFLEETTRSVTYRRRLRASLERFLRFVGALPSLDSGSHRG